MPDLGWIVCATAATNDGHTAVREATVKNAYTVAPYYLDGLPLLWFEFGEDAGTTLWAKYETTERKER